jgi:tripeptide aminopeptidase
MQGDGYRSDLARELAADAIERFLRYVVVDTQSDPRSETQPSTAKQLDLSRMLVDELREIGLDDARLDEHGYVIATLPATAARDLPTIGLIAHVDTVPGVPSAGVEPQVIRYEGGDHPLPGDPGQVLRPEDMPELDDHVGHELVTSDGTTLLGADDKGGVAEIMAAVAYLAAHPELEHGPVRIAFTPDEEIGTGTHRFDIEAFGADVAYTLDGSTAGEIQDETFSALAATVTFVGRAVHPGSAKGVLVNALKLAADFVGRLPREGLSPETTEEREGFIHPGGIEGNDGRCSVELILRAFDESELAEHERLVRRLAQETVGSEPRASVQVDVKRQYRNMKQYLRDHPRAVEAAREAVHRAGLEPQSTLIRGGTDGSQLSERGLPTPNLFTGGQEYHSLREWICVPDMGSAAETVVHLVQVWAEDGEGAPGAPSRESVRTSG